MNANIRRKKTILRFTVLLNLINTNWNPWWRARRKSTKFWNNLKTTRYIRYWRISYSLSMHTKQSEAAKLEEELSSDHAEVCGWNGWMKNTNHSWKMKHGNWLSYRVIGREFDVESKGFSRLQEEFFSDCWTNFLEEVTDTGCKNGYDYPSNGCCDIFIEQSQGSVDNVRFICRLKESLYGLKIFIMVQKASGVPWRSCF